MAQVMDWSFWTIHIGTSPFAMKKCKFLWNSLIHLSRSLQVQKEIFTIVNPNEIELMLRTSEVSDCDVTVAMLPHEPELYDLYHFHHGKIVIGEVEPIRLPTPLDVYNTWLAITHSLITGSANCCRSNLRDCFAPAKSKTLMSCSN